MRKEEAKRIKIGDVLYFSNKKSRNYGLSGKVVDIARSERRTTWITLESNGTPFLDDRHKFVKIIASSSVMLSFDDPETTKIKSKNDILDDIERRIDVIKQDIIKLQTVIDEYKENDCKPDEKPKKPTLKELLIKYEEAVLAQEDALKEN